MDRSCFVSSTGLWSGALTRSGGPWLFGARSNADAMFAPVVTRLRTYAVQMAPGISAYCAALLSDAAFLEWEKGALAETWTIPETDELHR